MSNSDWHNAEDCLPPAMGGHFSRMYDSAPVLCAVKSSVDKIVRCKIGSYNHFVRQWTEFEENEYRGTSRVTHWMELPCLPGVSPC